MQRMDDAREFCRRTMLSIRNGRYGSKRSPQYGNYTWKQTILTSDKWREIYQPRFEQ